jgi:hypothetical protein
MPPTLPFWISFVATVLLMLGALCTGWKRRRRLHLVLGPLTIVSLAIAVVLTEELMQQYTFPAAEKSFHLIFAKAGGLLAVPVVLTGLWLWRSERARVWHRLAVLVWVVSVLVATGTGLWMFSLGAAKAG